MMGFFVNQGYF